MSLLGNVQVQKFGNDLANHSLNFENTVIYSSTKEFDKKVDDSGLSIKMGIKGKEHYILNNEKITVCPDSYLIVNKHQEFECHLKSNEEVEALCLYVSFDIAKEVFDRLNSKNRAQLDCPFEWKHKLKPFWEKLYFLAENELGEHLQKIRKEFLDPNGSEILNYATFYYQLAEKMIKSQLKMEDQINNIESAKLSTRKELYNRLTTARNYIFDNYRKNIQLDELSKVALLSKYHLLRTYKQVYAITPYQEVLKLRLESAKRMMKTDKSLEEIAFQVGFSDRRSFTKAFKKELGIAPSLYRNDRGDTVQFFPDIIHKV